MSKIDQAIAWMEQRKGKVTYSMNYRTPAFSTMTTTRLSIATLATMAFPSIRTTRFGCITVLLQSRFIVPLQK